MALDKQFFESIDIDIVKKKYYNANKVQALLADIQTQAEALIAENTALRAKVDELQGKRDEISDTLSAARILSDKMVEKAQADADDIVRSAEASKEQLLSRVQLNMVTNMQSCIDALRQQQMDSIELINSAWQSFLCQLDTDGAQSGVTADDQESEAESEVIPEPEAEAPAEPEITSEPIQLADVDAITIPEPTADLSAVNLNISELQRRVSAIAEELRQIGAY